MDKTQVSSEFPLTKGPRYLKRFRVMAYSEFMESTLLPTNVLGLSWYKYTGLRHHGGYW